MALTVTHTTPADNTFSPQGKTEWDRAHTVSGSAMEVGGDVTGGTATRVLFVGAGPVLADSANLTFNPTGSLLTLGTDVVVSRYAAKQVMISGDGTGATTNAGWVLGYAAASGQAGIWPSAAGGTFDGTNYALWNNGAGTTNIQGGIGGAGTLQLLANQSLKMAFAITAGAGPSITAGTATTDVAALSVTRTNNDAAVATGVKFTFTDTSSAAGFKALQILGGASGTTNLISVSKAGLVDAPAYSVAGGAGADFGPGLPTSITVVKGIVTAIS